MKKIPTILGRISTDQFGYCQCHEHIMLSKGRSFDCNPALCMDDIERSLKEVATYNAAGGSTIIDAQPIGCNRMETALAQISEETNVNILSATGFHKLIFYPKGHWIFTVSEDILAKIYEMELMHGMYIQCDERFPVEQCAYRASLIKAALDIEGLTPRYLKLFNAAIKAMLQTNAVIMVHIEPNANPTELLSYLKSQDLDLRRFIFCHMDRICAPLSFYTNVLKEGVYLEFDTIGRFQYHSDEVECHLILQLLAAGFEDQLLLSLDTTRFRLKSYCIDAIGLDYMFTSFIPLMRSNGISEEQIHKFFHFNSTRIFSDTCLYESKSSKIRRIIS